jgi:hypothetical protein
MTISRIKPNIREQNVAKPITPADLARDWWERLKVLFIDIERLLCYKLYFELPII